jgi:hypothetical protein
MGLNYGSSLRAIGEDQIAAEQLALNAQQRQPRPPS